MEFIYLMTMLVTIVLVSKIIAKLTKTVDVLWYILLGLVGTQYVFNIDPVALENWATMGVIFIMFYTGWREDLFTFIFDLWKNKWVKRLTMFGNSHDKSMELMNSSNPMVIPRNHKVEEALTSASNGDLTLFNKLIKILKNPYLVNNDDLEFMSPTPHSDNKYQTFCGT